MRSAVVIPFNYQSDRSPLRAPLHVLIDPIKHTADSLSLYLRRGYLNIYYHCLHKYIVIDSVGVIYEGNSGTPAAALLMERKCDNDCTERSIISRSGFARALLHGHGGILFLSVKCNGYNHLSAGVMVIRVILKGLR